MKRLAEWKLDALSIVAGALIAFGLWVRADADTRKPKPPAAPVIRVPAVINEVHDGDTLSVSFEFSARVRLIDCWAPELKSGEPGTKSKANLIKLTSKHQRCMIEIPIHDDIGKSTSLGRVLGRVTVEGQDKDLSTQQGEGGFATKSKE
ncbi:MAG: hypothetical protein IT428_06015 [Planctomycetaceae bacterium]|nr:hypothetical protein [Planctomycetaceae bacterium]